ncbi:hypothetical protein [Streptomyces caniscabiei]|uniref:Secreted protein n=1 Tax=Streptomyces caniscabiei TaxID=2746961 RepID=A0ABU4MJE9_9ACTN|nr:hypothetical protein [Streptomyces caniscabiei]MBE4738952.1 hypothetical protein [Streptomyces caniscabiei]MBE4757908.1 hypothetical protein [Streptomyces caniscabiei]MBE4772239.1 hypothetical protein [Streptomyces caniscabiei]MBE4787569.1 hypothetical protein [Streptomyces caniscabiei]MBE4794284.1 hypothetical protein [Streptomyces caniscabiei]
MKFRYTMKSRMALTTVTIATGLVLTVAGCSGGEGGTSSDAKSPSSSSEKSDGGDDKQETETEVADSVLAEVKGENGLTLVVSAAGRDAGGFVTVEGTVTNNTGGRWMAVEWRGDERELAKNGGSLAGANLVDQAGKKKYLVLRDTSGRCLCTQFSGGVRDGESAHWYAQFPAPPEDTTSVDFQVGSMPPATIELSEDE